MEGHTSPLEKPGITILEASEPEHFDAARTLFTEYINSLFDFPDMYLHHDMKNTANEIEKLETGKYSASEGGAIVLARLQDEFIGAVALRKLNSSICEMKRLYVVPKMRGAAIGLVLAQQIIEKGRHMGYQKMRLDTLPGMAKAHQLYYSLGFYDIQRYNDNRVPGSLFMEVVL